MTGDMVPVDAVSVLGIPSLKDRLTELVRRVRELRLDLNEYICLKYILLLNPGQPHCILASAVLIGVIFIDIFIRAAGLIALTRRLTRLSINRVKVFNRALIVNFSASHFSL